MDRPIRIVFQSRVARATQRWLWVRDCSLTGRNNKSSSITEISVNDNSITDSKLIAESFNKYFVNIGPSLDSEASEEPLTQHTTNSYCRSESEQLTN